MLVKGIYGQLPQAQEETHELRQLREAMALKTGACNVMRKHFIEQIKANIIYKGMF